MAKLTALPPMPRRQRGWGTLGVGNWAPATKQDLVDAGTCVVGVCAKCHQTRRAIDLCLWLPPFSAGGSEVWVCNGGCDE